jgi:ectoine hydroxylase
MAQAGAMNDSLQQKGFCQLEAVFTPAELKYFDVRLEAYLEAKHPGVVLEDDGETIRATHGMHLYDEYFAELVRDRRLLEIATEVLEKPCYVHQLKLNMKQKVSGESWPWHQDYVYWRQGDNILSPILLNIAVFLDDTDMASGPLCGIPYSHMSGDLTDLVFKSETEEKNPNWESNVSKQLTYQISHSTVEELIGKHGLEYFVGKKGDVVLFDPLLVHSSGKNVSRKNRRLMIITYNTVDNHPRDFEFPKRPEFICARDYTPLNTAILEQRLRVPECL